MPVTFVAGTGFTQTGTGGISVSANAPSGLADGDALFAAVFARNTPITAPSGWTLQSSASATFSGGSQPTQYLRVFRKDAVVAGDSGTSYTFTCDTTGTSSLDRMGVLYSAFRGVDTVGTTSSNNSNGIDTYSITPPTVSAATDGSMLLVFASGIFGTSSSTPTPPSSFTLSSGGPFSSIRLAAAYRAVNSGQSNSGAFVLAAGASGATHGMGSATLLLAPASTPVATGIASTLVFGLPTTGDGFVQGSITSTRFGTAKSGQGYAATGTQFAQSYGTPTSGTRVVAGAWTSSLAFGLPVVTLNRLTFASSIGTTTGVGTPSAFRGIVPRPVGLAQSLDVPTRFGLARAVHGVSCAATGFTTTIIPGHGLRLTQAAGAWTVSTAFGTPGPRRGGVATGFTTTVFGQPQIGATGLPQGFTLTAFGIHTARARFNGTATGFSTTQIPAITTSAAPSLRTRGARFRQAWGVAQAERTAP